MPFEPVKRELVDSPSTNPAAVAIPIPAGSSFWSLPAVEQQRLLRDLETYRRELPRLIKEGHVSRYAVIQEDKVVSVWDTAGDAMQEAMRLGGDLLASIYQIKPQDVARFAQLERSR